MRKIPIGMMYPIEARREFQVPVLYRYCERDHVIT